MDLDFRNHRGSCCQKVPHVDGVLRRRALASMGTDEGVCGRAQPPLPSLFGGLFCSRRGQKRLVLVLLGSERHCNGMTSARVEVVVVAVGGIVVGIVAQACRQGDRAPVDGRHDRPEEAVLPLHDRSAKKYSGRDQQGDWIIFVVRLLVSKQDNNNNTNKSLVTSNYKITLFITIFS